MPPRSNILQVELIINTVIWTCSVLYSIYCFAYSTNRHFRFYEDEYSDFTQGVSFLSKRKDVGDDEWQAFKFLIHKLSLWIIALLAVSEIFRKYELIKVLHLWRIFLSILFVFRVFGIGVVITFLFQPILFAFVLRKRSKCFIWLSSTLILSLIISYNHLPIKNELSRILGLNPQTEYFTIIGICWMNLRCVSYCLDFIDDKRTRQEVINFLSYCFYLPNLICGPFISYKDFIEHVKCNGDVFRRFLTLLKNVLRFSFWILFVDLCLHYIYVNAISFHPEWIKSFDSWSLYGYGYTMGQYFHLKYIILYGLSTSFAQFENIKVPSLPVCIGRIHLYSDMWKYFDSGLYNFLLKYIYVPLIKSGFIKTRLVSSLICFIFVFVWHGVQYYILIWSLLNYIGVVLEYFAKWISQEYIENSKVIEKIGPIWFRRLRCLAASPLLTMSAISNFYFFAGAEIGYIFALRILNDTFKSNLMLMLILYNCCQVSTEVKMKCENKKYGNVKEKAKNF